MNTKNKAMRELLSLQEKNMNYKKCIAQNVTTVTTGKKFVVILKQNDNSKEIRTFIGGLKSKIISADIIKTIEENIPEYEVFFDIDTVKYYVDNNGFGKSKILSINPEPHHEVIKKKMREGYALVSSGASIGFIPLAKINQQKQLLMNR